MPHAFSGSGQFLPVRNFEPATVNFHCDQAIKRLDVSNRAQAVAKAVSEHLLSL
jgi:DNA-binding NarL/FixJ family response regulator